MYKKSTALVIAFALLIVFASFVVAQQKEEGWEKTVTLQSGEVILDMSGEWDMLQEGYGPFGFRGSIKEILTIRQEGASFTAVKQIGSQWVPKGAEAIKGELDKNGFKTVFHYIKEKEWWKGAFIWETCKWIITDNGNKVVLDCGERIRATLTRRLGMRRLMP
ncbi:MAG: hypothetical protein C4582_05520 [Desulfobacteraceae bacterium]|nr:MAG: hypothetical protein C4582_05520 [Desulfobacteraceae bacterium]